MFVEERHRRILERLRERGKVTVEELAGQFNVSSPTVRADLAALETRRLLRRTHGGALPLETSLYEPPYAERAGACHEEKRRIGQAAAALIRPGETVILDAGTTTHEVALALKELGTRGVTVVTNNLPSALLLMDTPGVEVIVVGGQAQPRRRATLGPLAVEFLKPLRADRVFLGVSGVDSQAGLTAVDFDAVQVKRAMIAHAADVVVVADASKVGQAAFAHVAPLSDCRLLLIDSGLSGEDAAALCDAGLSEVRRV
ncbi:MAG TPA: DeoR/GlpR family DNA-binding transcription regulator [Armatimonadaceae bacterium]|nr:DeoR/GlpR family DNA-binding transcription regulator [Armatimonadaceae bacterium]